MAVAEQECRVRQRTAGLEGTAALLPVPPSQQRTARLHTVSTPHTETRNTREFSPSAPQPRNWATNQALAMAGCIKFNIQLTVLNKIFPLKSQCPMEWSLCKGKTCLLKYWIFQV